MKYKVITKAGVAVFECDYRYLCHSRIRQALRKAPETGGRTVRKKAS